MANAPCTNGKAVLTEEGIEVGKTYRFRNELGVETESTVISFPKPWIVRFRKPSGKEHDITIKGFLRAFRLYGIE